MSSAPPRSCRPVEGRLWQGSVDVESASLRVGSPDPCGRPARAPVGEADQARQDLRFVDRARHRPGRSVDRRQEHRQGDGREGAAGQPPPHPRRRRRRRRRRRGPDRSRGARFRRGAGGCRQAVERIGRPAAPGIAAGPLVRLDRSRRRARPDRRPGTRAPAISKRRSPRRSARSPRSPPASTARRPRSSISRSRCSRTRVSPTPAMSADRARRRRGDRLGRDDRPPDRRLPGDRGRLFPRPRRRPRRPSRPRPPPSLRRSRSRRAGRRGARRRGRDTEPLPLGRLDARAAASRSSPAARRAMWPCSPARAACRWSSASARSISAATRSAIVDGDRGRRRAQPGRSRPGAPIEAAQAAIAIAPGASDAAAREPARTRGRRADHRDDQCRRTGRARRARSRRSATASAWCAPNSCSTGRRGLPDEETQYPRLSPDRRMGRARGRSSSARSTPAATSRSRA